MLGEWCFFKSYFDKSTCEEILNLSKNITSQKAVVGIGSSSRTNLETRRSKIKFIEKHYWEFNFLFDSLMKAAIIANNDFFNFHISKLDYIQLAEYNSDDRGEYKDHHDVFWLNNDPVYHRKLSCIVQLTDPNQYEGGDFQLIDTSTFPNADDIKQQGTVIFFPSFFLHRALPVTKGIRHSLAAWFDGPKWR